MREPGGRERPILFSGPMVRAILEGRKTQTRRLYKPRAPAPYEVVDELRAGDPWPFVMDEAGQYYERESPYGVSGDRLYVREAWARRLDEDHIAPRDLKPGYAWYWADPQTCSTGCAGAAGKRRPGIHMPRWAARIVTGVTAVRFQRLNDISEEDAKAEGLTAWQREPGGPVHYGAGIPDVWETDPREAFARLWDVINAKRAPWASNPWVWAVTFNQPPSTPGGPLDR